MKLARSIRQIPGRNSPCPPHLQDGGDANDASIWSWLWRLRSLRPLPALATAQTAADRHRRQPNRNAANVAIAARDQGQSDREPRSRAIDPAASRAQDGQSLAPRAAPARRVDNRRRSPRRKARCAAILKGLDAVVDPQPPIKEGQCGAPAPIRLSSLGKTAVTFSPPPLVNCEHARRR